MTDNEIIKGFEYCFTNDFGKTNCNKCEFYTATAKCMDDMQNAVMDLINRQKAEIERLREIANHKCQKCVSRTIECAKSEVIKEFAERICNGRVSNDPVVIAVRTELECIKEMTEQIENE